MVTNANIIARASELQGLAVEKAIITTEGLIAKAEEARVLAMNSKQPAAAVAAIQAIGKLAGIRVDKSERKNTSPERMTDAEIDAELAAMDAAERDAAAASDSVTSKLN